MLTAARQNQFRAEHQILDEEDEFNMPTGEGNDESNQAVASLGIVHVNPCENESFFARFNRSLHVPTHVGEDLDSNLAELVNHIFQHPLSTEDFVRLKEGTLRPGNCTQLQVPPPILEAIWVKVSGELKGRDKATQKLHGDFLCFLFSPPSAQQMPKPGQWLSSTSSPNGGTNRGTQNCRLHPQSGVDQIQERSPETGPSGGVQKVGGTDSPPPCPTSLFGEREVDLRGCPSIG